ncbi:MAG: MarR family transcriptional regulator [Sphaerochaeta sp.]
MQKSIGRLISILHRQCQIYSNKALKDLDLTSAEYPFLLFLYRQEGRTQEELSTYLYIDKAATARAIKSLEEKGYVTKQQDQQDKRCNRIYLTEMALQVKDAVRDHIHQWSTYLAQGLDEKTYDLVYTALEAMVARVESNPLVSESEEK